MNTNASTDDESRYEKLAKPKERIEKNHNFDAFKVKPEALSYQITDKLMKLAQPKQRPDVSSENASVSLLSKTSEDGPKKLINRSQRPKDDQESRRKRSPLDTYAGIAASKRTRCSKRLLELARPRPDFSGVKHNRVQNYDSLRMIKKYDPVFISKLAKQKRE